MKTATWPPGPDIRGHDLIWFGVAGVAGAGALIAVLAIVTSWFESGSGIPSSGIELGTQQDTVAGDFWPFHLSLAASYAYMLLICYVVLIRQNRYTWKSLGFQGFELKWLTIALAASGMLFVASDWIISALKVQGEADTYNRSLFFIDGATALTITAEVLLIGPATAIIEELLFRGLLHRWIRQRLGLISGVAASATIFSVVHFSFVDPGGILGWYWTVEIVVFGAVLALLYEWSGSLWPPAALHTANNAAAVALAHMGL